MASRGGSPLFTKQKNSGYQPIVPTSYDHQRGQETPTKTPTVTFFPGRSSVVRATDNATVG